MAIRLISAEGVSTESALPWIAGVWICSIIILGWAAGFRFRAWLTRLMDQGRIPSSALSRYTGVGELRYFHLLREADEDIQNERLRRRATNGYMLFMAAFTLGFLILVILIFFVNGNR